MPNIEVQEVLNLLISLVILPAIPITAKFVIDALRAWAKSKSVDIENKTIKGYVDEITDIISQAVISTTQTYVDALKAKGEFTIEAQKEAFTMTKDKVLALLAEDAKDFIAKMYGDVDLWLDTKIEQKVAESK